MPEGEIDLVTELAPDFRAGNMSTTEYCEGEAHASVQGPGTAEQRLKLILSETVVVIHGPVKLAAQGDSGGEIVAER